MSGLTQIQIVAVQLAMGEGGQQVLDIGGRAGGIRGSNGRPPLPTKFVEQISFQEIEEREVANKKSNRKGV